ncbi:MAG: hypothetical protein JNK87_41725 [Bryobacterales bacterium]|nr:hypothetical protein [Bryobacterales bacterium]
MPLPAVFATASSEDLTAAQGSIAFWQAVPGEGEWRHVAGRLTEAGVEIEFDQAPTDPDVEDLFFWAANPAKARRYLASAFYALSRDIPLLVAAPAAVLSRRDGIPAWIRFLWYTLPESWSLQTPMVSFTRAPWGATAHPGDCVVAGIPTDEAYAALQIRRESMLIDEEGEPSVGEPDGAAIAYAEHVCSLLDQPHAFESLRQRLRRLWPIRALPQSAEIDALPLLVSWSKGPISLNGERTPVVLERLLLPSDYERMSPSSLLAILRSHDPSVQNTVLDELERRHGLGQNIAIAEWDSWMTESPVTAMQALLACDYWGAWRDATRLLPAQRRQAAIVWCESPFWNRHEPRLEDWVLVLRDLEFRSPTVPAAYPRITWFDAEQADGLAALPLRDDRPSNHVELADPNPVLAPTVGESPVAKSLFGRFVSRIKSIWQP